MSESSDRAGRIGISRLVRSVILILLTTALCVTFDVFSVVPSVGAQTRIVTGVAVGSLSSKQADLVVQAGITFVRTDVDHRPEFVDVYSVTNAYRIKLIGILDYETVAWNDSFTLDNWKGAVDEAQQTYPLIRVWEVWNEPTQAQYQVGYMNGSPEHYFDLLKSAYTILKTRDPSCVVLGLGGAQLGHPEDIEFAKAVFGLGGASFMDAISIHAYPYSLNKGKNWSYYADLWSQEIPQYGVFGKAIWVTETGLQSSQLTDTDQAQYLRQSVSFFSQQGVSNYIWFQLTDYRSGGTLVTFGLLRTDTTTKASYDVYAGLISGKLTVLRRS